MRVRDTNASTLNIVEAGASATTQQNFNSNGTPVCILRTVTTKNPTSASSKLRKT